jgi:peptidylprolyl isomerase
MFRALPAAALAALLANAALAQAPAPETAAPAVPASNPADWRALDAANTLVMDTTKGRIIVEMHPELAPAHVARIKALSRMGYYTGAQFYRVLGFAAQGGDKGEKQYRSALPNLKGEFFFRLGPTIPYASFGASSQGDLGFVGSMPVLIDPDPALPSGQTPTTGRGSVLFCPGVASFPHGDAPDTANSQVFFMKVRGTNLEKTFTAWGRVVQGQDVVEALKMGEPPPPPADKMLRVRVMADMPAAERPMLQVMDTRGPAFAALLQAAFKAKGAAFTLCDVTVPTRPG